MLELNPLSQARIAWGRIVTDRLDICKKVTTSSSWFSFATSDIVFYCQKGNISIVDKLTFTFERGIYSNKNIF